MLPLIGWWRDWNRYWCRYDDVRIVVWMILNRSVFLPHLCLTCTFVCNFFFSEPLVVKLRYWIPWIEIWLSSVECEEFFPDGRRVAFGVIDGFE